MIRAQSAERILLILDTFLDRGSGLGLLVTATGSKYPRNILIIVILAA